MIGFHLAPAHRVCAGAFVFALIITGCERAAAPGAKGPRTLELDGDTLQLEPTVSLHDVAVRSVQGSDFDPVSIQAKAGDIVRFTSRDGRMHGIVITAPTPEGTAQLEAAGQLRSPPLITRGQAWVVTLEKLAPGSYSVSCISHAGTASIVVQ